MGADAPLAGSESGPVTDCSRATEGSTVVDEVTRRAEVRGFGGGREAVMAAAESGSGRTGNSECEGEGDGDGDGEARFGEDCGTEAEAEADARLCSSFVYVAYCLPPPSEPLDEHRVNNSCTVYAYGYSTVYCTALHSSYTRTCSVKR